MSANKVSYIYGLENLHKDVISLVNNNGPLVPIFIPRNSRLEPKMSCLAFSFFNTPTTQHMRLYMESGLEPPTGTKDPF